MADQKHSDIPGSAFSTDVPNYPVGPKPLDRISLPAAPSTPTPIVDERPSVLLERLDIFLVMLLLVLTFLISSFAATNSDVWMHLASGNRIAQGEWTIGVEPFSFTTEATPTRPAVPWIQQSWLYSLLFYWLYTLVGGEGLVVLKALAMVVLAVCLLQIPGGKKTRILSVIYVGLAMLAISPQLILRPMTLSYLFFGFNLFICYRAGALGNMAPKPRLLWCLPILYLFWANLDAWFILGPLTLLLLLLGNGLGMMLGLSNSFPSKTLAAVLIAGMFACLLNPHGMQVFMLPPELANMILYKIDLPDSLGAGGRALRNLQMVDPDSYPLLSPLSIKHWGNASPGGGQNIAGLAYYPLLLLGLVSFVVNSAVTKKPGAPGLHPGRFLLWAFLAFLSLMQARLIPWFAIAGAPITVLNLVDWRIWLAKIHVPNWKPLLLGRVLMLLLFAVGLYMAWPGWLYGPAGDFNSPRRVAWKMPIDPSPQGAALYLTEKNKGGKNLHVFNFTPEIAHYCSWFAPGVKCFFDSRWPLFTDDAARVAKTRLGLITNQPEAWQKTLVDRNVDYVVLNNFQTNKRDGDLAAKFWEDEYHWFQKYGDGRMLIFAWSGPDETFAKVFRDDVAQRAFGPVPEDLRSPAQSADWPQEGPSFWSQYWEGLAPFPLVAQEANYWLRYYQTMGYSWQNYFGVASQVARGAEAASQGCYSITLPYSLFSMGVIPNKIYTMQYRANNNYVMKARDFGPPGAPLLMIRCARRAIAENPNDPRVYWVLSDACKTLLNRQEDHWANYQGDPRLMRGRRSTIRQIQIMTALRTYLDLRPDDPEIHELVATMFLQMNFLDVALDHFQKALQNVNQYRADAKNPQAAKLFENKKKSLEKGIQTLEAEVKKRHEQFALEAASKKGLDKYRLALIDNRGLVLEAIEQLNSLKPEGLSQQEAEERNFALIQHLLMLGRANLLTKELAQAGPRFAEFKVLHDAALGNYADLDKVLADLEKDRAANRSFNLSNAVAIDGLILAGVDQMPLPARLIASFEGMRRLQVTINDLARPEAELLTLRGIMALEYGDTAAARKHMQAALHLAGPDLFFIDRPIAERYNELLQTAK